MQTLKLPNGADIPKLGLGTWRMGEDSAEFASEVRAIAYALDQGIGLIDTAEMYGEGGAELALGQALKAVSTRPYIVSKVYPFNGSRRGVVAACEASLKRMGIDRIDLYLLHWRGGAALEDTIAGFEDLVEAGKIAAWGVSNFDAGDMAELWAAPGGAACQTNQALYNLGTRWAEGALLPALAERHTPLMAYSPLGQGGLARTPALQAIARQAGMDATALALAWAMRREDVFAVPKSTQPGRIEGFIAAADLTLPSDVLDALETAFPPPPPGAPLEML